MQPEEGIDAGNVFAFYYWTGVVSTCQVVLAYMILEMADNERRL